MQAVAAGWAMTTLTNSEYMVALVTASTTLPIMVLSLVAGVLADNYDRRRIMLIAQTLMLLVSFGLTLTNYLGVLTPWLLLELYLPDRLRCSTQQPFLASLGR